MIDEHDQSCAHFNRRVGSRDRGARLTYAYNQVIFIDPMSAYPRLSRAGQEHNCANMGENTEVRHGSIRGHFSRKCNFGRTACGENIDEFIVNRIGPQHTPRSSQNES